MRTRHIYIFILFILFLLLVGMQVFSYHASGATAPSSSTVSYNNVSAVPATGASGVNTGGPTLYTKSSSDVLQFDTSSSATDVEVQIEDSKRSSALDTFMFCLGLAMIFVPLISSGLLFTTTLGFPPSKIVFSFLTRGKINPYEIKLSKFLLLNLPILVLGILLINGWFKQICIIIWQELLVLGRFIF